MGNISIQQPHRFGKSLDGASQREGYGRSQAPLEQPGALSRDTWGPRLPPEHRSCGRAAGHGRAPLSQRNSSPLHRDTQAFHKMGYLTTRGCCWCASFLAKWVEQPRLSMNHYSTATALSREAHVCQSLADTGCVKWDCTSISLLD